LEQLKDLTILDVQPNVHDYFKEHLPGAIYCNEGLFRVPKNGRPAVYVEKDVIGSIFGRLGLERDTPVLVYTGKGAFTNSGDGLAQTMAAYTLARFGMRSVHMLDGGIDEWKAQGGEVTQIFPFVEETAYVPEVSEDYFIDYDTFTEVKDNDEVVLLDARPPMFYEGAGPWIKEGHIPGAINLPWKSLMEEANAAKRKDLAWIKGMLIERGITPDKRIICSCGTGREATNEFVLFKWVLKYPEVQIYEGSFTEWSAYPENPTVTGPSPR
jgi:thiosulfate/3-mercaptopyruvate sulfurtransferase